jgi:hypothetical protein
LLIFYSSLPGGDSGSLYKSLLLKLLSEGELGAIVEFPFPLFEIEILMPPAGCLIDLPAFRVFLAAKV